MRLAPRRKEAGRPVLLKRGMSATIEEWLTEHIAQCGNLDIVLGERGIRTFDSQTRNPLDVHPAPHLAMCDGSRPWWCGRTSRPWAESLSTLGKYMGRRTPTRRMDGSAALATVTSCRNAWPGAADGRPIQHVAVLVPCDCRAGAVYLRNHCPIPRFV